MNPQNTKIDDDLYSRQLLTFGHDAMEKMAESNILIAGMNGLGVEVAKNVCLAGVRLVTVQDTCDVTLSDLATNYYLSENDLHVNRAKATQPHLAELNGYVPVEYCKTEVTEKLLSHYQVAVFTDLKNNDDIVKMNDMCRKTKTKFVCVQSTSVFGRIFNDFGDKFIVKDTNGEPEHRAIISDLILDKGFTHVRTVDTQVHDLTDGDLVRLKLKGLQISSESDVFEVRFVDRHTFSIDVSQCKLSGRFEGGEFEQVKPPKMYKFLSFSEAIKEPKYASEDFLHNDRNSVINACFSALDSDKFAAKFAEYYNKELSDPDCDLVKTFDTTRNNECVFTNSVLGGFAAQEVIKGCSGKYGPIDQFFCFESIDSISKNPDRKTRANDKYDGMRQIFGSEFVESLLSYKVFVVGAGAIGCELLKNFATAGVACGNGKLFVTDMDTIEKSNLNRQFLFRASDIGDLKSKCAATAAKRMNPSLNIESHQTRVGVENRVVYDRGFYENLDIVVNALDNVDARRFVDRECQRFRKPLLESGTSGTKGNTQVIVPDLSESYSDTYDPPEKSIPICTIKNFPYEDVHVLHWAKEGFEKFSEIANSVNRYLNAPKSLQSLSTTQQKTIYKLVEQYLGERFCKEFSDCVYNALLDWHEDYRDQIRNILKQHPEDEMTEEGGRFWSGTKRCPVWFDFNLKHPIHVGYVFNKANLYAALFNIEQVRDTDKLFQLTEEQLKRIPDYKEVDVTVELTDEEVKAKFDDDSRTTEQYLESLPDRENFKKVMLNPIRFEKDDDTNFHIDYITACANMRALNYGIQPVERLRAKGVTGNIIPAIATTTGTVAGLVCFELCKFVNKEDKLEKFRNYFLNMATPFMAYSEPGPAPSFEFNKKKYTFWSNTIMINEDLKLAEFIDRIKHILKRDDKDTGDNIQIDMVNYGVMTIYSGFCAKSQKTERRLSMPVSAVIEEISKEKIKEKEIKLEIVCTDTNEDDDDDEGQVFIVEYSGF